MYRAKQLWQCGENVYLAGLNEDGTHYQTKYLRREDYLPLGAIVHMEGHSFRVDTVNFDKGSVTLQDVALAEMRMPIFREEPLALVRELYEQEQEVMEHPLPDYKVGDNVIVDLPTRTIEGKIGYVGETDVRIDTSAHGQSWDNEVINKRQFEDGLRQVDLDEITGGRGVIFATGTPLSNSMTEMYTLMRYLQYNTLQQKGLTHFDAWASTFGETTTAIELAPEGYTLIGR